MRLALCFPGHLGSRRSSRVHKLVMRDGMPAVMDLPTAAGDNICKSHFIPKIAAENSPLLHVLSLLQVIPRLRTTASKAAENGIRTSLRACPTLKQQKKDASAAWTSPPPFSVPLSWSVAFRSPRDAGNSTPSVPLFVRWRARNSVRCPLHTRLDNRHKN